MIPGTRSWCFGQETRVPIEDILIHGPKEPIGIVKDDIRKMLAIVFLPKVMMPPIRFLLFGGLSVRFSQLGLLTEQR
jgi:hypothetical protein